MRSAIAQRLRTIYGMNSVKYVFHLILTLIMMQNTFAFVKDLHISTLYIVQPAYIYKGQAVQGEPVHMSPPQHTFD